MRSFLIVSILLSSGVCAYGQEIEKELMSRQTQTSDMPAAGPGSALPMQPPGLTRLPAASGEQEMSGQSEDRLPIYQKAFPRPVRKQAAEDADYVTVLPEVAQAVEFSNTDNNRLICSGPIQDIVYSAEKGIIVKFSGQNAFVKFKILKKSHGELVYAKTPAELFVVCNDETYNLIALPRNTQARTVRLSSGKKQNIRKNASLFSGLALEKKVLALIKFVHRDEIPDTFEITPVNRKVKLYKGLGIVLSRIISVEGEGLLLKEYLLTNAGEAAVVINEGHFLKPEITRNTIAVAIGDGKMNLNKGETVKLYAVELADGGNSFVKN